MTEHKAPHGLLHLIFADMPPTAKAVLSFLLIVPLTLAISGMLLNINVGAVLEDVIALSLEKQRGAMNEALDVRFIALQQQLEATRVQTAEQFSTVEALLTDHAAMLESHDARLSELERRVLVASQRPPLPTVGGN